MSELEAVLEAQRTLAGRLVRTPIHRMDGGEFSSRLRGVKLVFKLEMLQRTGSFKIRGALNKLSHLTAEEKARGVVGMSSGNHAQALAYAAKLEGVPATVVMPSYSVPYKVAATRALGAEIVQVGATEILSTYERLQDERGLTPVHPFDDPLIIAGAGTAGLELFEDVPEIDVAVVSAGGGGLLSGVATALQLSKPEVFVYGAEPKGACALRQSLDAGQLVFLDSVHTVADGLAPPFTGENVLDRVRRYVDDVVVVSDEAILNAMRLVIERVRVVVEPSAVAGFAALLTGAVPAAEGSTVGVFLSGGNIDAARLKELL